jgi:hypothetical protein
VRWHNVKCPEWDKDDPELEMERSPPVQFNPGPPFVIGDIVFCDAEECGGLPRGFVTRAEHPIYIIFLDNGHVVDTSKTPAWLVPTYAEWEGNTNGFAPYVEPPMFTKLHSEMNQLGSFGTHIDAQRTVLWTVFEAKDYAKAVKADDAGILLHLWNDCIFLAGVTSEVIGVALAAFWKFGWLWFMKCLLRDSIRFMRSKHGVNWSSKPRRLEEGITALGCDQAAIMSLLWHSFQTDWFLYNAGSKLVHF